MTFRLGAFEQTTDTLIDECQLKVRDRVASL